MNIDALPHNQRFGSKTMFLGTLPPYNPDEIDDLDHFKTLPLYKSAVEKGLIVNDRWKGPEKGYCKIREYKDIF